MRKIVPLTALIIGLLVFTSGAEAQRRMEQQRGRHFARFRTGGILMVLKDLQQELNITEEQLARIEDISMKLEEQRVEHQNTMNSQHLELRKLMMDRTERDYEQIRELWVKSAEGRADMMISQMKLRDQIDVILTPEQKEALENLGRDRIERRSEFMRGRAFRRTPRIQRFRRIPSEPIR